MKRITFLTAIPALLLGVALGVCSTPVFAVDGDPPGLFELDGNTEDLGLALPDDWDYLSWCSNEDPPVCGSVPYEFTGILADPAPMTIFTTGGSKDTHDILDWKYKDGSVPDKDDITNAYAAAYINPEDIYVESELIHEEGDLIIYFGLDRFDNSGDAFAGFWFLQNSVDLNGNGRFTDGHVAKGPTAGERGDLLILVEYPQGSGAVPLIKAYEWDPYLYGDPNEDEDGKNIGPLEMIYSSANGSATALCDGGGGKLACAITNTDDGGVPNWDYLSKDGTDSFPYETFYEGGINLTQLLGGENICVHTFLAETRSSRSETAQLKDFVHGKFELCGSNIRTEVHDPDHTDMTIYDPVDYEEVRAGTPVHDFAEVGIIVPGIEMDPEGDVRFQLFDGLDCTNLASGVTNTWTFAVLPGPDPMGNGVLEDNSGWAATGPMVLPAAQCYSFQAEFLSDAPEYFPNVTAACEPFCIAKYPSDVRTEIHVGTNHDINRDANCDSDTDVCGDSSVELGTTLHDHAYASGGGPAFGTGLPGTMTFYLWKNGACADTSLSGTFGGQTWPVTVDILADGTAATPDFTPMQGENITFSIKAEFNGDDNYLPSGLSDCEVLTANQLKANVVTMVLVRDMAKVTDDQGAPIDDGAVTFQAYASGDCSLPKLGSAVEVNLNSEGEALEPVAVEITLENNPHTISYKATYDGGSGLYAPEPADCEKVTFEVP